MRPWLLVALAATGLAAGGLALWPAGAPDDLLPPGRPAAATRPQPPAAWPAPAGHGELRAPGPAARHPRPDPVPAPAPAPSPLPSRPADWPAASAAALAAWQGPPAAAAAPPPAVRPVAVAAGAAGPVFPYRWIGQLDDGGAPQVLLASAQRSVAVRLGATLDGRWRLQQGPGGVLQAQALPDGPLQAVPGAPLAAQP